MQAEMATEHDDAFIPVSAFPRHTAPSYLLSEPTEPISSWPDFCQNHCSESVVLLFAWNRPRNHHASELTKQRDRIGAGCAPSSVPLQLDVEDSLQPGGCSRKCWSEKRGAGTYDRVGIGVGSSMSMSTGIWGFGAAGHWGLGGAWGGGLADLRPGVEGLDIWGGQCRWEGADPGLFW